MSLLEIDSVLFEEITYSFDNDDIEEQDVNLETNLHSIKIFNNDYIIAMGKKNIHKLNNNLIYFLVYLIYNKKVITKIGVYEVENKHDDDDVKIGEEEGEEKGEEGEETGVNKQGKLKKSNIDYNSVNFNELSLLLFEKYYKDKKLLEPFKQSPDNMINTDDEHVILVNDKFNFLYIEERQKELLKTIFFDKFNKDDRNINFSYSYLSTLKKSDLNTNIEVKIKEFIKKIFPRKEKKITSMMDKYINNSKISILFYVIMELILNIKIIVVDENNNLSSFSLLGDNNVSDDNKKILNDRHGFYQTFNPKNVLFIKKINSDDDNYHILKYNEKYTTNFDNVEKELLKIINNVRLKENNEYNLNTQFEYLQNIIKELDGNDEYLIRVSPQEEMNGDDVSQVIDKNQDPEEDLEENEEEEEPEENEEEEPEENEEEEEEPEENEEIEKNTEKDIPEPSLVITTDQSTQNKLNKIKISLNKDKPDEPKKKKLSLKEKIKLAKEKKGKMSKTEDTINDSETKKPKLSMKEKMKIAKEKKAKMIKEKE